MPEKSIELVLKEHATRLMALHGVIGTAVGECDGKPCIKVYVTQMTEETLREIPSTLGGYTVTVQETGGFQALER